MSDLQQDRDTLQAVMNFIGALASGIEESIGNPSKAMAYCAGKSLGKRFSADAERTVDLEDALAQVREVLLRNQCLWHFEPFKRKASPELIRIFQAEDEEVVNLQEECEAGDLEIELVFRDCMIRQALFKYGHEQKMSLCSMMYGFLLAPWRRSWGKTPDLTFSMLAKMPA